MSFFTDGQETYFSWFSAGRAARPEFIHRMGPRYTRAVRLLFPICGLLVACSIGTALIGISILLGLLTGSEWLQRIQLGLMFFSVTPIVGVAMATFLIQMRALGGISNLSPRPALKVLVPASIAFYLSWVLGFVNLAAGFLILSFIAEGFDTFTRVWVLALYLLLVIVFARRVRDVIRLARSTRLV